MDPQGAERELAELRRAIKKLEDRYCTRLDRQCAGTDPLGALARALDRLTFTSRHRHSH